MLVLPVALLGGGYLWLTVRARARQGWALRRTAWFGAGVLVLAGALSPRMDAFADRDFSGHAAQHLLLAMVGPLLLVLGRPVTLMLRALPYAAARRLGALLGSAPARVLAHPVTALLLSSGGLVALYLTPLYRLSTEHAGVHLLVHAHLVLSGLLFAWVVTGLEPGRHRAGVRTRLVVLGCSSAVHACVSQLLYAGLLVQVREPVLQMQAAGSLMYFGGDIAELLLAVVLLSDPRRGPVRRTPRVGHVGEGCGRFRARGRLDVRP